MIAFLSQKIQETLKVRIVYMSKTTIYFSVYGSREHSKIYKLKKQDILLKVYVARNKEELLKRVEIKQNCCPPSC